MLLSKQAYKVPGILRKSVLAPCPDPVGQMEDRRRERALFGCCSSVASPLEGRKLTVLALLYFLSHGDAVTLLTAASPSVQGELWRQHADLENAVTR